MRARTVANRLGRIGIAICVVIGALWLATASHRISYTTTEDASAAGWTATLGTGELHLTRWYRTSPSILCFPGWEVSREPFSLGFSLPRVTRLQYDRKVAIPVWNILTAALIPTIVLLIRRRHAAAGHCGICGYDLIGNISGKCPECGTPATPNRLPPQSAAPAMEQPRSMNETPRTDRPDRES